jgi:hypothetical protein
VREPGVDPDAFDRTHLLEDASGNIVREASSWDEPAWKLTTFVQENYHYPFPASRRRSHQTTLPAPGEWSSIPLTPAEAASGLSFIGCFGTGTYRLHTGAVSVLATTNARPFGFATESALDDWTLQTTEPCVFFLSTRGNGATNWTGSTLALVRFSFNGTNWIPCRPDFSFGGGTLQHSSCASWVLPFQMLRASFGAPLHIDLVHRTRQSNVFYIVPPAWKR